MPVIPDLKRLGPVDASHVLFKGHQIPKGWEMPENIWAVVQRIDRVEDAAITLYSKALTLLRSAATYVELINRRDDFSFSPEDAATSQQAIHSISYAPNLVLKSQASPAWDLQYLIARKELDSSVEAFKTLVHGGEFLHNARRWCPASSLNGSDLEEWYQKVENLAADTVKWTRLDFTFRDILLEISNRGKHTRILGDVLTTADLTRTSGISVRREVIFELGIGSGVVPKRRMVWVSDKLASEIEKRHHDHGPLV